MAKIECGSIESKPLLKDLLLRKPFFILFLFPLCLNAQKSLDSLWNIWNDGTQSDSARLFAMKKIAWDHYVFSKPDSAFYFAQMMYDFAKEKGIKERMAVALNIQGTSFAIQSDYNNALDYLYRSLQLNEELGDTNGITTNLNNLGNIYKFQGNLAKAIEFYTKSLQLKEKLSEAGRVSSYTNIGNLYAEQGDFAKAMDFHYKGLNVSKKLANKEGMALAFGCIANTHYKKEEIEQALEFYVKSVELDKVNDNKVRLSESLRGIGNIHFIKGNHSKAITYYTKSLQLSLEIDNKSNVANTLVKIGNVHYEQGEYVQAIDYGLRSKHIAEEVGAVTELSYSAKSLWKSYKKVGKYDDALIMHELYIELRDSLQSEKSRKELIRQEYKYAYEKKAAADSVKAEEAKKVIDAQLVVEKAKSQQKEQQSYFLFSGLSLALLFGGIIYNRLRITSKQKAIIKVQKEQVDSAFDELEVKNREILDSISYAKRIQTAILPPNSMVEKYLNNSFILYKPKDIVSGDFYWIEPIEGGVLFAVADCTGHGVPGAMVSVLCNNALKSSVREYGLTNPAEILGKARELIVEELEKGENEVMDGMDIAICSLIGNTLTYSGANNPLWIIRKGSEKVEEIKADRQPVGKFHKPAPYTSHSITLHSADSIYIFSDGYIDQFGGERGKKFRAKALRELLLSIQGRSMKSQCKLIEETFNIWKGELDQIDDVCMIGLKVA